MKVVIILHADVAHNFVICVELYIEKIVSLIVNVNCMMKTRMVHKVTNRIISKFKITRNVRTGKMKIQMLTLQKLKMPFYN